MIEFKGKHVMNIIFNHVGTSLERGRHHTFKIIIIIMMKIIPFIFLALTFFFSCSGNKESNIITFRLDRSDFVEKIIVRGTVQAVINTPVIPPRNMYGQMTIEKLAGDGDFVQKGDTICILRSPGMESKYEEMKTSIETLEAELKKAEAENKLNIALLEAQLNTNEAQLKISSLDSLKMKFASGVNQKLIELEMKRAFVEKMKIERKLAATRAIGETDLKQKRVSIMQEKEKALLLEDQIRALTIISGREGIVQRTVSPAFLIVGSTGAGSFGGPIREGSVILISSMPVLQFPDISLMQISADVSEADFRKLEKGQKVILSIDAAKKLVTTGKINRKNLSASSERRYTQSKVKNYEVIIDIDSCHSKITPGLSANCEILIHEVQDTLAVPTLSIFEKDSINIVYVKEKKKFRPVRIETGISGSSYTIIASGLRGNETIALSEPPASLILKEKLPVDTTKIETQN